MRPLAAASLVVALMLAFEARAEPQAHAGLTLGVVGRGSGEGLWQETRFHSGLHGDILFGRSRNLDLGLGPYAEVLTAWDDVEAGTGLSVLLPVHAYLPMVASIGGYGRHTGPFGWEPGASMQLFWGSRSFNYSSTYVMAGGLRVEGRLGLGDAEERSIILAAHIDTVALGLPFLLAFEWIRGGPDE